MIPDATLLLTRGDVANLINLSDCIVAVEHAFKLHGDGKTPLPRVIGVRASRGAFHVKAALYHGEHSYFAAKINANFPENKPGFGLPSIQGVIVLCDGEH